MSSVCSSSSRPHPTRPHLAPSPLTPPGSYCAVGLPLTIIPTSLPVRWPWRLIYNPLSKIRDHNHLLRCWKVWPTKWIILGQNHACPRFQFLKHSSWYLKVYNSSCSVPSLPTARTAHSLVVTIGVHNNHRGRMISFSKAESWGMMRIRMDKRMIILSIMGFFQAHHCFQPRWLDSHMWWSRA